ncbi:MAG: hypothetical protein HY228_03005 [Candidatus Yonathbacteria bacterium]|nr:hypothetical protein [Candidatus Yonathbacteria bacterium]
MINLLPLEEKKKIRAEYRLRLSALVMLATALSLLASLILLSPVYLLTLSKYQFASEKFVRLESEQGKTEQEKELNAQINEVNKKTALFLKEDRRQAVFSEIVTKIIETKGSTIRIQNIFYETSPGRERFVISGRADDRDLLALFVENLKKDPFFTTVDIPISSYIKSTDIDFSVILEKKYLPVKK